MSDDGVVGSSDDDPGDAERRKEAKFHLTAFAEITEPAYRVWVDKVDKSVIVEFAERSQGDTADADDSVLQMTFRRPTTLLSLSKNLGEAGLELAEEIGDSTIEADDT